MSWPAIQQQDEAVLVEGDLALPEAVQGNEGRELPRYPKGHASVNNTYCYKKTCPYEGRGARSRGGGAKNAL